MIGGSGVGAGGISGIERECSRLDQARQHSEKAAQAYRRARLAASRHSAASSSSTSSASNRSAPLRASRADLIDKRAALAAEVERVGRLACSTLEAAAALAVAFRAAREALEKTDLLAPRGKVRRRSRTRESVKREELKEVADLVAAARTLGSVATVLSED
jgi:hypothetical protein